MAHTQYLLDGTAVDVVGHLQVDGKVHFIVKLSSPKYINEKLVSMVLYPLSYFKDTYIAGMQKNQ